MTSMKTSNAILIERAANRSVIHRLDAEAITPRLTRRLTRALFSRDERLPRRPSSQLLTEGRSIGIYVPQFATVATTEEVRRCHCQNKGGKIKATLPPQHVLTMALPHFLVIVVVANRGSLGGFRRLGPTVLCSRGRS